MNFTRHPSRRLILQAGAASAVLGAPGFLLAQPAPVKVGLIHPVSGGLAYSGGQSRMGAQMAIDEVNAAGGIKSMGGAKLEALLGDSQSRPEVGVSEVERMQADSPATLAAQLAWLTAAGFEHVNCWYQHYRFAVFSGSKSSHA